MSEKPLILAVETSSRIGSAAIAIGAELLAETSFSGPMRHSTEIFPAIQSLMKKFAREPHEISQIHISAGPGSFTGLRIAISMAKAMHLANGVKIIAVDTLDVIAANVSEYIEKSVESIAVILDAKRGQFFIAVYENHQTKIVPDCLMTAEQFIENFARTDTPIWLLGDGLLYNKEKFQAEGICFFDQNYWSPRASNVHLLGWKKALAGQFSDPVTLCPTYLLRPDIKIKPR